MSARNWQSGQLADFTQFGDDTLYEEVEVQIAQATDGTYSLWVNVDGVCRVRATRIPGAKLVVNLPNSQSIDFPEKGEEPKRQPA